MSTTERVDTTPIIARMAELCPQCISVYEQRRKPLAVGIRDKIIERVGDAIKPDDLAAALRSYVRNPYYLRAMAQPGAMRIDIEGNPVEAVAPAQAASAAKAVAAHWARVSQRKAAARMACAEPEAPAPRPVHSSPAPCQNSLAA
jgi:ProP effector